MNIRPTTTVNANVWKQFILAVARKKGIGKGVIKNALEEALEGWCENEQT
jgi:hypothetical protein